MHPFGYLKASTTLSCVNLFVLPYNYPLLLPILDELIKVHRLKQTPEWRAQFQAYLRSTPGYYNAVKLFSFIKFSAFEESINKNGCA